MKQTLRALGAPSQKALAVFVGTVASSAALADGTDTVTTKVDTALTSGTDIVTTVVVGVVGIAAIALGLSMVLGLFKKV